MTKRECAIIMAHTGICMLEGNDFNIFHKYCEDLLGHPIFTHQFPMYEKEIKERSFEDFKELCACSTVEPHWVSVTEMLPEYGTEVVTINKDDEYEINHVIDEEDGEWFFDGAVAWMPLPEPYKGDDDGDK